MITADFETRSEVEIKKVGSYRYASHASTTANCLAFAFDDEEEVHLWHPAFPFAYRIEKGKKVFDPLPEQRPDALDKLFDRLGRGDLIEAHNAFFERCIWHFVMVRKFGWPEVQPEQWRCSAAKARSFALPGKLEMAAKALGVPMQKDTKGAAAMLVVAKPRKPVKAERDWAGVETNEEFYEAFGPLWNEDRAKLDTTFEYCKQDVRTERAFSGQLRDLPPIELETWQLDQQINWTGVYIDRQMVEAALKHTAREVEAANAEVCQITEGEVSSVSKRDALIDWIHGQGGDISDLRAETIDHYLEQGDGPEPVLRALELRRRASRTSTKKYEAMLARMADDDRVRDILLYHGASTGRWSGMGIQPQNFPRGSIKDMDTACEEIRSLDREELALLYGDVMELISGTLRGAICAPPGYELLVADYSAIEARGTFWLAGETEALGVLAAGQCIYKNMAGKVYRDPDPQAMPKSDPRRQLGKQAILGLGYGMGPPKFKSTCAGYGIEMPLDDEEALANALGYEPVFKLRRDYGVDADAIIAGLKREHCPDVVTAREVVNIYRDGYPRVKQLWYSLENAAIEAVNRGAGGEPVRTHRTMWAVRGRFLHCRLPSGRLLSYCDPWLEMHQTPWGELRPKLFFMGIGQNHQWGPLDTYGGKLTENVVQALSRDLMRDAMLRAGEKGFRVVLSVHDELVCEVPEGVTKEDVRAFEALMSELPRWADEMPVEAEGFKCRRYRK